MSQSRVLLVIGSAKQSRSTSEALGTYLLDRLSERGFDAETLFLHRSLQRDYRVQAMLAASDRADILVLASPLYVDSLPYLATRALELIALHRNTRVKGKRQRLLAIVNCGFPEAQHTETAIAICRRFAREAGFEWAAGLGLGGGEAINGRRLRKRSGMVRNVVRSLDVTATALADGQAVPEEAARLMARPLMPTWLYTLAGSVRWRRQARAHGARQKLSDRPYEHTEG